MRTQSFVVSVFVAAWAATALAGGNSSRSSDSSRVSVSVPPVTAATLAHPTREGVELSLFPSGDRILVLRVTDQRKKALADTRPAATRGGWLVVRDENRAAIYEIWQF